MNSFWICHGSYECKNHIASNTGVARALQRPLNRQSIDSEVMFEPLHGRFRRPLQCRWDTSISGQTQVLSKGVPSAATGLTVLSASASLQFPVSAGSVVTRRWRVKEPSPHSSLCAYRVTRPSTMGMRYTFMKLAGMTASVDTSPVDKKVENA